MSLDQTELGVGSYLKVCLGEPTTFDVAGYEALSWSDEVIDVVNIGEGGGSGTVQSYTPLKTGVDVKRTGAISYSDRTTQMGRHVQTNAVHQLIKSGFDGANKGKVYSFAIHYPDGSVDFQTGTISSFTSGALEASAFMFANFTMSPNRGITTKPGTDMWTLTYLAGSNGSIVGTAIQTVEDGEDGVAVYASPANLYEFVSWSDSETDNPRTDLAVSANITVTATFALI